MDCVYFVNVLIISFQKNFTTQMDDNADDINLVEGQPREKDALKATMNMWKNLRKHF